MKVIGLRALVVLFVLNACAHHAYAGSVAPVARQQGALNSVWLSMLRGNLALPGSGVGRVSLQSKDGDKPRCQVNLYFGKGSTYVEFDAGSYHDEFYIDHPRQRFSDIYFQDSVLAQDGSVKAIHVQHRDGAYRFDKRGDALQLWSSRGDQRSTKCLFPFESATVFLGETE